jgi:hypothetical protein
MIGVVAGFKFVRGEFIDSQNTSSPDLDRQPNLAI